MDQSGFGLQHAVQCKVQPGLKLADHEIKVMRSWLLYIPAGLIEVHPHMKYQLATISRTEDSTLDKNGNLDNLAKVQSQ